MEKEGEGRMSASAPSHAPIMSFQSGWKYAALTALCFAYVMWFEDIRASYFLWPSAFVGVVLPSWIWIKALSKRIPPDQLFLKTWHIPLWWGIATSVIGIITVLASLGEGDIRGLGRGVALLIPA